MKKESKTQPSLKNRILYSLREGFAFVLLTSAFIMFFYEMMCISKKDTSNIFGIYYHFKEEIITVALIQSLVFFVPTCFKSFESRSIFDWSIKKVSEEFKKIKFYIVLFFFFLCLLFCYGVALHPKWMKPLEILPTKPQLILSFILNFIVLGIPVSYSLSKEKLLRKNTLTNPDLKELYETCISVSKTTNFDLVKGIFGYPIFFLIMMLNLIMYMYFFFGFYETEKMKLTTFLSKGIVAAIGFGCFIQAYVYLKRRRVLKDIEHFETYEKFLEYDKKTKFSKTYSG